MYYYLVNKILIFKPLETMTRLENILQIKRGPLKTILELMLALKIQHLHDQLMLSILDIPPLFFPHTSAINLAAILYTVLS